MILLNDSDLVAATTKPHAPCRAFDDLQTRLVESIGFDPAVRAAIEALIDSSRTAAIFGDANGDPLDSWSQSNDEHEAQHSLIDAIVAAALRECMGVQRVGG